MTNEDYEAKIRHDLQELFNDGFTAFEKYRDNPLVYEMCVRQHLDKAKMLSLMNTDLQLLCKSIGLDFKTVVEEEYQQTIAQL